MVIKNKIFLLAEIKNISFQYGGECLSDVYITSKTKLKFKCLEPSHPMWEATPNNIKNGTWCPRCSEHVKVIIKKSKEDKKKENLLEIITIVTSRGQCLSSDYVNSKTKLLFKCNIEEHPTWWASPSTIKAGQWCKKCADFILTTKTKHISETIICSECSKEKNIDQFYDKPRRSGSIGKDAHCMECDKQKHKEKYTENKKKFLNRNYERREKLYQAIDVIKQKPCMDCGKQYEPYCMDFDHVSDNKLDSISKMIHNTQGMEKILLEISKTELVCVMCHKTRTYNRFPEIKNFTKYKQRNLDYINNIKSEPCFICKNKYNYWQMEFDHLQDKKYNISTMVHTGHSLEKIKQEVAKCVLLCALCHRKKTFRDRGYKKWTLSLLLD